YRCLAIGASTGGPVALQKVLSVLPEGFAYPIFLVQHMPGTFTKAFAERLNQHCHIRIKEAEHGDVVQNGWA
ncbi:chemotaxis protein CheB, partial [Opacimonas viscosa]